MNTKHWFMAIATLAIAGCSQNEIMEKKADADKSIGFNVYTGVQTKGTETTNTTIEGENVGFGVVALNSDKNAVHMTMRNVKKVSGSWTYDNTAYWPVDGKALSFYSYAPYNDTYSTSKTTGGIKTTNSSGTEIFATTTPSIEFTIKSDWANMVDLVAAKNEDVATGTTVSVAFKHVLTRIGFKAKTSAAIGTGTTVKVTKLEIVGSTTNSSSAFYEKGTYNIKTDAWSDPTALSGNYTITMASDGVALNGTTAVNLLGDNNYLFCIPVTSLGQDAIKVKITYTITSNSVTSEKTQIASIPQNNFAKGTAYSYLFTITLKGIEFTLGTMENWTTTDPADTGLTPTDLPTT